MEQDENKDLDLELNEEVLDTEPDWKAEALKYKSMAKRYKDKAQRPVERQEREITTEQTKTVGVPDEVIDLRLDGYSKEEVEFIIKNGGRKALEDTNSFVSIALNTKREQAKAESAAQIPDSSQLSEVERKFTPEQLKNMSAKELETLLPHA